jgi:hypothetical protein
LPVRRPGRRFDLLLVCHDGPPLVGIGLDDPQASDPFFPFAFRGDECDVLAVGRPGGVAAFNARRGQPPGLASLYVTIENGQPRPEAKEQARRWVERLEPLEKRLTEGTIHQVRNRSNDWISGETIAAKRSSGRSRSPSGVSPFSVGDEASGRSGAQFRGNRNRT